MGHGVTCGMSWLICPTRRCQQSVSVCSVCAEQRVNTPTFTSSLAVIISLLSSQRTDVLCLFDITEVFMVTTHTGGQRGEATSVSVEQDEWDSHTSEKTEKTCKVCCSASSLRGICWIFTTDSTEFNRVLSDSIRTVLEFFLNSYDPNKCHCHVAKRTWHFFNYFVFFSIYCYIIFLSELTV